MQRAKFFRVFFVLLLVAALASCGGTTMPPLPVQASLAGTIFVLATDAPLASVLVFRVAVTGMTASDGTNTVPILSGPQDIEFARLNGLRTLLDVNTIPAGSYTSVTVTLA